jgi:hypothetical protein
MESILELFFEEKEGSKSKKGIYLLISLLLSTVLTSKIYGRFLGAYEIIGYNEYDKIVIDFLLSGRFVICLIMLFSVHLLFHFLFDILLTTWLVKKTDELYEYLRLEFTKDSVINAFKTSKPLQGIGNLVIALYKSLNIIDIENNQLKPGLNFYAVLDYFKKINDKDSKEHIMPSLAFLPLVITIQGLIILDTITIDHVSINCCTIIVLNLVIILVIFFLGIIYFMNLFVDLKKDKILKFLEELERYNTTKVLN